MTAALLNKILLEMIVMCLTNGPEVSVHCLVVPADAGELLASSFSSNMCFFYPATLFAVLSPFLGELLSELASRRGGRNSSYGVSSGLWILFLQDVAIWMEYLML